ncbi:MAG: chorismate mutase [Paraclostridium sp.]|uniref:chorismate mutase n=1 Tax=Paraclostridium sp. TaxID=2023273 RepID=UPI003F2A2BC7
MRVLAIRGATTVKNNSTEEILNETKVMVETIISANDLNIDDIISMIFTMTSDLDSVYPSVAVRDILSILDTPLLNFEEKYIQGSLRKCVRVMININSNKKKTEIKHIYLNEAKNLRPDISE